MAELALGAARSASPTWRRFKDALRRHPTAIAGAVVLLVMVFIAIFAPRLGTVDPQAVEPVKRLKPPSAQYWFGSDKLGRDVYSRVIYGTRVSLVVGLAVALLSTLLGLTIGLITGYLRWLDAIVMRIMDGLMSIPPHTDVPEDARKFHRALRVLRDANGGATRLPILSMGMTDDMEIAIEEGATLVRVGTAIFGKR